MLMFVVIVEFISSFVALPNKIFSAILIFTQKFVSHLLITWEAPVRLGNAVYGYVRKKFSKKKFLDNSITIQLPISIYKAPSKFIYW